MEKNLLTWESDTCSWVFFYTIAKAFEKMSDGFLSTEIIQIFHRCTRKYFDNGTLFENQIIYNIFTQKKKKRRISSHSTFLKTVQLTYQTPSAYTLNKKYSKIEMNIIYVLLSYLYILVGVCKSSTKISNKQIVTNDTFILVS